MEILLLEGALIFLLILANGLFAASELAVVSARKGRLEQQAADGVRGAAAALALARAPDRFLSTVQIGITLIGTLAAAFGGERLARPLAAALAAALPAVRPYAEGVALALVVLAISYLSLVFGELTPKRLALQNPEGLACRVAPLMRVLARIAAPFVTFLAVSSDLVLWLLGRQNVPVAPVTEDDVIALAREGAAGGTVEPGEQAMIASVFRLTDRSVRSLMTPRTQVVALAIDTPPEEVRRVVAESGYSRIPVYRNQLDDVVGILFTKDLLRAGDLRDGLAPLLRPAIFVPASQRAVAVFQVLRQQRSALAIVLDEYGQVAGIVSIEDILEALVGEIEDEYDEQEEAIVRRDDGSLLVDGLLSLDDARARLGLPEPDEELRAHGFETVAGLALALFGRIPRPGERVTWAGYTLEVMDMDGRRIDKLLIRPPDAAAAAS
jgi:putative hemolysin